MFSQQIAGSNRELTSSSMLIFITTYRSLVYRTCTSNNEDIAALKSSRLFQQRCSKHLWKVTQPPETTQQMLDEWFIQHKCTASAGALPALGRLDPITGGALFTSETKSAVENCKLKAQHLQDPLPLEQMHAVVAPNPNSPHGLNECLSQHGESNLESFHLMLAHFANCGKRESLADNLNLSGTARHNLAICHKL